MSSFSFKSLVFIILMINICSCASKGELKTGFYSKTCPMAETIVLNAVKSAVSADRQMAARLLRLFFHDCFVQGCDGSILLENGDLSERFATGNAGLGGFDVIRNAKTELESKCPGVVSCADIVALAARDAVLLTNGPSFEMPTGRRDGRVSKLSLAADLPEVDDSIETLKSKFQQKGMSDKDLLLLSAGGHTIGTTACFFMLKRRDSDPAINPSFLPQLKTKCPLNGEVGVRLPLDCLSDTVFDNHIFINIRNGFAVIASDARLNDDKNMKKMIDTYANFTRSKNKPSFKDDFAKAMVKLGNVDVKTGSVGEIRRVCSAVN